MFDDITITKTRRTGETELTASVTFPKPVTMEGRRQETEYWTGVIDRMIEGPAVVDTTTFGSGFSFPKSDE